VNPLIGAMVYWFQKIEPTSTKPSAQSDDPAAGRGKAAGTYLWLGAMIVVLDLVLRAHADGLRALSPLTLYSNGRTPDAPRIDECMKSPKARDFVVVCIGTRATSHVARYAGADSVLSAGLCVTILPPVVGQPCTRSRTRAIVASPHSGLSLKWQELLE
jgi:hypothetical protein